MKKLLLMLIFFLYLCLSGCGTIMCHGPATVNDMDFGIYNGTRAHIQNIRGCTAIKLYPGVALSCIDLPFSIVADTAMIPIDIMILYIKEMSCGRSCL